MTTKADVTVIGILLASDGTSIKKRQGAHPFYVSIGNLSPRVRASPHGWRVAGFLPRLDKEKMSAVNGGQQVQQFTLQRRRRQMHNQASFLVMESLIRHESQGGLILMCGDGIRRRILFRCRDDEMHQFRAGIMHHLFTASVTAFEEMVEEGAEEAGMVFNVAMRHL